jgi:hypothetical protein
MVERRGHQSCELCRGLVCLVDLHTRRGEVVRWPSTASHIGGKQGLAVAAYRRRGRRPIGGGDLRPEAKASL